MSLSVRSCFPGDLVVPPEALEAWCNSVEARLAALEAGQVASGHKDTPKAPAGVLWWQMCEAAARSPRGDQVDFMNTDGAAMIRAVAAYIERWAGCDTIDTEQLMNVLESQAKIAELE